MELHCILENRQFQRKKQDMDMQEFLTGCTACGGNWSAKLLSGIKKFFPEYYNKMEDRRYNSQELCHILDGLGVKI